MYEIVLILLIIALVFALFFLTNFRWCIKTLRNISSYKNRGGYTKLIQLGFIVLLSSLFILIFLYYLIKGGTVEKIDLFLTVIVGWLGAIIGRFFGERAMEGLEEERQLKVKKADLLIEKYNNIIDKIVGNLKKK